MQLMKAAVLRDRDCSNMCSYVLRMTSTILYRQAENERKLEIAFSSVNEWNESECGLILSPVSEFMNIFGEIGLFGSVSATVYPLLALDNQSSRYGLLVYRTSSSTTT
jgi:hypothetical protein